MRTTGKYLYAVWVHPKVFPLLPPDEEEPNPQPARPSHRLLKIGVTQSLESRMSGYGADREIIDTLWVDGYQCYRFETRLARILEKLNGPAVIGKETFRVRAYPHLVEQTIRGLFHHFKHDGEALTWHEVA